MRTLLVVCLLATPATAAPVPKTLKKKDDATLLVGTWKPAGKQSAWFQFAADGTLKTYSDPNGRSLQNWTWVLEETERLPKRMKLTRAGGGNESFVCVYELDGDTLKIGFVVSGQVPEKVEAAPGVQLYEQSRDTSDK